MTITPGLKYKRLLHQTPLTIDNIADDPEDRHFYFTTLQEVYPGGVVYAHAPDVSVVAQITVWPVIVSLVFPSMMLLTFLPGDKMAGADVAPLFQPISSRVTVCGRGNLLPCIQM